MQSIDLLRQLAVLDRERIEHAVTQHGQLRLAGNFDGMAEYYSGHAVLELVGNPRHFIYAGIYEGVAQIIGAFKQMQTEIEFLNSEIKNLLIDQDSAMMRCAVKVRHRGTGLALSQEIWDLFRFEDGLISHHTKMIDVSSFKKMSSGTR